MAEDKRFDVSRFQESLASLCRTIRLKLRSEGLRVVPKPVSFCADIHALLGQAGHIYSLFFYLNADEKRHKEAGWSPGIGVTILPLIRTMVDVLYNITALAEVPARTLEYRMSGYLYAKEALDEDERRYGTDQRWIDWISSQRRLLKQMISDDGFTEQEIIGVRWPTLGAYLKMQPMSNAKSFLSEFGSGMWKFYSSLSHAGYDGLLSTAVFYSPGDLPHDQRDKLPNLYERTLNMHLPRVAGLLLCSITEVQAFFRFDGANINSRLNALWNILCELEEVKELYDGRYRELIVKRQIAEDF
jgi:hypothetical protein